MTSIAATDPRDAGPFEELRPEVELPREAVPVPLLVVLALVLAAGLFFYLEANRQARLEKAASGSGEAVRLPAPPPALLIPPAPAPEASPEPPSAPAPAPMARPAPIMVPQPAPPPMLQTPARPRSGEPAMVFDGTTGAAADAADPASEAVRATIIRNRGSVVPQGAIIAAVLETPLNSDRPGLARAMVSQDVRSFDGSRVLIPRGSRLIGEFKADTSAGLSRVLVTWNRMIRSDGVAIRIGSPVTDSMGGAGAPGRVNSHFFQRFATAVLQSALTIGVNVASQLPVRNGSVYVGVPGQMAQAGQQLVPSNTRPPTVKVKEGQQIAVLVARDLDFGGTPAVR